MIARDAQDDDSVFTRAGKLINGFKQDVGGRVAQLQRPVYGNTNISKAEERRLYWQVTEGWDELREAQMVLSGMPRPQIGLLKYDQRERVTKSGGRANSEEDMAKFCEEMERLGPPEPEGLEKLAQDAVAERAGQGGTEEPSSGEPAATQGESTEGGPEGVPDGRPEREAQGEVGY